MSEYSNDFVETFRMKSPLPEKPWFDCDTTPPMRGRYATRKTPDKFKAEAMTLLRGVSEGQIGIYESAFGGRFYGYAIKYSGDEPFFEEPSKD